MSVAGTWNITIASPMGKQEATLVITEEGGALSGVARQGGEEGPMEGLAGDASELTWKQKIVKPMPLDISFKVSVSGDSLSGSAKAGMFGSFPVTGERA